MFSVLLNNNSLMPLIVFCKKRIDKLKGEKRMELSLGVGTKFFIEIPNLN